MRRRMVFRAFYLCVLSLAVMVLSDAVRASRPQAGLGDTWEGFYDEDAGANPGVLQTLVTAQAGRRIAGDGVLLDADGLLLFNTMNFNATLARSDFLNGTGRTGTGRLVLQADLETYPGLEGDASVMNPDFLFVPVRGRASRVSSTLLHPFPDADAPSIEGGGSGRFHSLVDDNFRGNLAVDIHEKQRGLFPGHIDFLPDSDQDLPFSWNLRATTSGDGRLIMIAQGKFGKMIVDGALVSIDEEARSIDGLYRLLFQNGRVDFGAYNFTLGTSIQ